MNNESLATELLHEIKLQTRRWFIAFIVMCVLEVATIGGFIWYISLPVEITETVQVENDDGNANYVGRDVNGGIFNGESTSNSDN